MLSRMKALLNDTVISNSLKTRHMLETVNCMIGAKALAKHSPSSSCLMYAKSSRLLFLIELPKSDHCFHHQNTCLVVSLLPANAVALPKSQNHCATKRNINMKLHNTNQL